jgi:polar amino acid transport system substrate-binding protein
MRLVRLAVLILFPFMCHAQSGTQLRLATLEYPPYSSEHLSGGGSLVELTRRAFAVEGHEVQIDFRPWARVRLALRNGTYQGALALWPREIAEEGLQPTRTLFYSELGLFMRRDTSPLRFTELSELRGRKLGIVRGYGYSSQFSDAGLELIEAVDDITNLRKLNARRFDMVLIEHTVGEYLIENDEQLRHSLVWQGQVLERIPLQIGFTPNKDGEPDWRSIFERGLGTLHRSGEYQQIIRRYQR